MLKRVKSKSHYKYQPEGKSCTFQSFGAERIALSSLLCVLMVWQCTFGKVMHPTMVFHFECVPESGATSTPEVGSGMWPVVDLFTKTPEDFCTSIMPRICPGTRSETQLQTKLQSVTTHRSVCSLTFKNTQLHHCREHRTVCVPSMSLQREGRLQESSRGVRKWCHCLAMFEQGVVRVTASEQFFLFFFTPLNTKASAVFSLLARGSIERCFKHFLK